MSKFLLYSLLISVSMGMAQTSPVSIYWNSHLNLNFTHYDSVYVMSDTTGGALVGSARLHLLNDRYVTGGLLLDQDDSVRFSSDTSSSHVSIYEMDFRSGDTNVIHHFYKNNSGLDTAYEMIGPRINASTGVREHRHIFYNSNGLVDSFYVERLNQHGHLTNASGLKYYYSGALIDSIFETVYSGINVDKKYLFLRNSQGEIEHEEHYADLGQGMVYQGRYTYLYNSLNEIDEVRLYHFFPQNSSHSLSRVYHYLKRAFFEVQENHFPDVNLFPNPARDVLHVEIAGAPDFHYQLSSISGQEVSAGTGHNHLDVSGLASGLYILKLHSRSKSVVRKILVQ